MSKRKKALTAGRRASKTILVNSLRQDVAAAKALCNNLIATKEDLRRLISEVVQRVRKETGE